MTTFEQIKGLAKFYTQKEITPNSSFADLGLKDHEVILMFWDIEDHFEMVIPENDFKKSQTIDNLINMVNEVRNNE